MSSPITMTDLFKKLKQLGSEDLILDVRSQEEYRTGHVPGSRNIPHDEITQHLEELKKYRHIYIHCQSGGRAGRATAALEQKGLTNIVCVVDSGMGDWLAAGYPVEK